MLWNLTIHTSLSPIWRGFMPSCVNYRKGALDSQLQVIKFNSCLPRVGGSLRVFRLPPPLNLVAMIYLKYCRKWRSTPKIKSYHNCRSVGARKPKGLNRLAKIGCLMSTKGHKQDSKNRLLNVNQRA